MNRRQVLQGALVAVTAGQAAEVYPARWISDCYHWHGRLLTGAKGHYCYDWDELPIDETCEEFSSCACDIDNP